MYVENILLTCTGNHNNKIVEGGDIVAGGEGDIHDHIICIIENFMLFTIKFK